MRYLLLPCSAAYLTSLPALAHGQSVDIRAPWMQLEIYQDTWDEGPGYPGPYLSDNSWGEGFDTCSLVDWWNQPGRLRLIDAGRAALHSGGVSCGPAPASVTLRVWDLSGRPVSRPACEADLEAGEHLFETGPLPPGVYLCRMTAGAEQQHTVRLVVIP